MAEVHSFPQRGRISECPLSEQVTIQEAQDTLDLLALGYAGEHQDLVDSLSAALRTAEDGLVLLSFEDQVAIAGIFKTPLISKA